MTANPPGRSAREAKVAAHFFYEDGKVLRNKLGIRDQAELDVVEANLVTAAMARLVKRPMRTFKEMQSAHKSAFGRLYAWAGQIRTYTTGRGAAPFAMPKFIEPEMSKRFDQIVTDAWLTTNDPRIFAAAAAEHAAEINAIHPFLEGNGRMTRLFIQGYAQSAGLAFSSANIARESWYAAAEASFLKADYAPLAALIQAHLTTLDKP